MDAKLNQLAKVDDFRKAYILAQYPHENGYRAATYEEFYNWINLRLELSGVEMAPVQGGISEENATLIPPGPVGQQRKMDASPGWYSVNGSPVEATSGHVWKWFWNGTTWSLVDMGELPVPDVSGFTEKGGYEGTAQDLDDKIPEVKSNYGGSVNDAAAQKLVTDLKDMAISTETLESDQPPSIDKVIDDFTPFNKNSNTNIYQTDTTLEFASETNVVTVTLNSTATGVARFFKGVMSEGILELEALEDLTVPTTGENTFNVNWSLEAGSRIVILTTTSGVFRNGEGNRSGKTMYRYNGAGAVVATLPSSELAIGYTVYADANTEYQKYEKFKEASEKITNQYAITELTLSARIAGTDRDNKKIDEDVNYNGNINVNLIHFDDSLYFDIAKKIISLTILSTAVGEVTVYIVSRTGNNISIIDSSVITIDLVGQKTYPFVKIIPKDTYLAFLNSNSGRIKIANGSVFGINTYRYSVGGVYQTTLANSQLAIGYTIDPTSDGTKESEKKQELVDLILHYAGDGLTEQQANILISAFVTPKLANPKSNYISIPTEIPAVKGDTLEVFKKSVTMLFDDNYYGLVLDNSTYQNRPASPATMGNFYDRKYIFTPAANDVDFNLDFALVDENAKTVSQASTLIKVVDKKGSPQEILNVVLVGDSFTDTPTYPVELSRRLLNIGSKTENDGQGKPIFFPNGDGLENIVFRGNRNRENVPNEGWSSRHYSWFLSNESPFWNPNTNQIDFSYYVTQYKIDHPDEPDFNQIDVMPIILGTNFKEANSVISQFWQKAIEHNPNIKLLVGGCIFFNPYGGYGSTPIVSNSSPYTRNYIYQIKSTLDYNRQIEVLAKSAGFQNNVTYMDILAPFDTDWNMIFTEEKANVRNPSSLVKRGTDGVHPSTVGYYQLADIVWRHFHAYVL